DGARGGEAMGRCMGAVGRTVQGCLFEIIAVETGQLGYVVEAAYVARREAGPGPQPLVERSQPTFRNTLHEQLVLESPQLLGRLVARRAREIRRRWQIFLERLPIDRPPVIR